MEAAVLVAGDPGGVEGVADDEGEEEGLLEAAGDGLQGLEKLLGGPHQNFGEQLSGSTVGYQWFLLKRQVK